MIRTLKLTVLLAVVIVLSSPPVAEAQQAGRVYRIGVLMHVSRDAVAPFFPVWEQRLNEHGYVVGRNAVIEYRFSDAKLERLADLAVELVNLEVDAIVAHTNHSIAAAKRATGTVPIVMLIAVNPVGAGFITSLAKPGGNVTGLTFDVSNEIWAKRVELLREAVPGASRVGILWNPRYSPNRNRWTAVESAGNRLDISLLSGEVPQPGNLEDAVTSLARQGAQALLVLGDPLLYTLRQRVAEAAVQNSLPGIEPYREGPEAGGLMSYGIDFRAMWRRAADYVHRILDGAHPSNLPVEQPTEFELVINLKTAKALGLAIPPSLLLRADQVIE